MRPAGEWCGGMLRSNLPSRFPAPTLRWLVSTTLPRATPGTRRELRAGGRPEAAPSVLHLAAPGPVPVGLRCCCPSRPPQDPAFPQTGN